MTTRAQSLASPGNAWPPGHRLGPFELQEVVSSRSAALVYRAWDHALQRTVAIKEYLPARLARRNPLGGVQPSGGDEAVAFEAGRRAFIEEARLLARCDHPSLLRVLDLLELHGTAYRVMPWLAGTPLAELRQGMTQPPDEAALRRLADDLLGALETWHAAVGTPHGGVEPTQVLLLEDDRAVLLGPGLARRATSSDAVESLMRQLEPAWSAPELLQPTPSQPAGPWTDFHALAQTLRFALTGQAPPAAGARRAPPLASTIERLYADTPELRYGGGLLHALDVAASPDIHERPQTAQQFRDLLAADAPPPRPAPAAPPDPPLPSLQAQAESAPPDDRAEPVVPSPPPPMADDETTARLIRSVLAAIPDAPPRVAAAPRAAADTAPPPVASIPPLEPASADTGDAAESIFSPDLDPAAEPLAPRPRSRRKAWLGAAAFLLLLGAAAWAWKDWQDEQRAARLSALPPMESIAVAPLEPAASSSAASSPAAAQLPASPAAAAVPAPPPPAAASAPEPQAMAQAPTPAPATASPPATVTADASPAPASPSDAAPAKSSPPAATAARARATAPRSPRELCGARSDFALYRCFQQQCAKAAWARHPQCQSFKRTDHVPG